MDSPAVQGASLPIIELSKLRDGDPATNSSLLAACQEVGFFYLDLRSSYSQAILQQVEDLIRTTQKVFDLPVEEKSKYVTENYGDSKIHGYRGLGLSTGPVEGKKDGFESYMISEMGLFGLDEGSMPFAGPEPIQSAKPVLTKFIGSLHETALVILSSLYKSLAMEDILPFEDCHRQNRSSATGLGLLRYLPLDCNEERVGHIAHTDAGSLSMVFSHVAGLQVLMPDDTWEFAIPRPGHTIVNVGDTLTFLSKGKLRSSLHRVVPHPDAVTRTKYTVVYLLRPELTTKFRDSEGKEWTAIGWHNRKFNLFRHAPAAEMLESSTLTGRKHYIGYWEPPADINTKGSSLVKT
ncbi:2og-fe oxygenase family protein [Phlyctema vagabunda]|uniref:2og-fe oxygenase family protein n=1 Tax=Phlyctema vagabunda TaxID=108571 RepID=A0ABR4P898_9HELO